jgi:hypothetical protein
LAELAATSDWNEAQMPSLQLGQIQGGRVALIRRTAQHVCAAARSLHVLLEALLLVCFPFRGLKHFYQSCIELRIAELTRRSVSGNLQHDSTLYRIGKNALGLKPPWRCHGNRQVDFYERRAAWLPRPLLHRMIFCNALHRRFRKSA